MLPQAANASPKPPPDEAALLALIESNDSKSALEEIARLYGGPVYRYIRHTVGTDDLADDVWQTTLLQAYRDLDKFKGRSSLRSWLYGIARHRCLDAIKSRGRRRQRFPAKSEAMDEPDSAPAADERLSDHQVMDALETCLQELEPQTRTVLLLRYQQGFSYKEIAEICRIKSDALRARVSRAMPRLRRCIEARGVL